MTSTVLILGGTGKTGRQLARLLRAAGTDVRPAARSSADVIFDWAEPATHPAALDGVDRLYLVPPAFDLHFTAAVLTLLDSAHADGVRHVTYLSAGGVEQAPPEVAMRAVELDLMGRDEFTSTILRPAFFMQNFTSGAFSNALGSGVLALPAGNGAEAFVDVHDIAGVAAASLLDPDAHAGRQYALTGPAALTHTQVAELLTAHGHPVVYQPISMADWIAGATAAGLPADYAGFLATLLVGIGEGAGARPTDDVEAATGRPPTSLDTVIAREL